MAEMNLSLRTGDVVAPIRWGDKDGDLQLSRNSFDDTKTLKAKSNRMKECWL